MVWNPPPEVRRQGEATRGSYPYVRGSQITAARPQIQLSPAPGVAALAAWLQRYYGLREVGTRRGASLQRPARKPDGTYRFRDVHEEGRAIDAMTYSDLAKGRAIANALVMAAPRIGLQYIIFDRYEWGVSNSGPAWEPYEVSTDRDAWGRDRTRSPHTDHVHIEISPAWANDIETMRAGIQELERIAPAYRSGENSAPVAPGSSTPSATGGAQNLPASPAAPYSAQSGRAGGSGGISTSGALLGLLAAAVAFDWYRSKKK